MVRLEGGFRGSCLVYLAVTAGGPKVVFHKCENGIGGIGAMGVSLSSSPGEN